MRKYEDRIREEVLDGDRPWSSLTPQPKSTEKWEAQYGSGERVEWGKARDCDACGRPARKDRLNINAHTETGGMGMKAGPETLVTLCPECDHEIAQRGVETFQEARNLDLRAEAARVARLWREHNV